MDANNLPVLIFQMGKVGSQTLQHTLVHNQIPCISVHSLSREGIDYTEQTAGPSQDTHDRRSIRRLIDLTKGQKPWKVITLVRDPVARLISDAFQNGSRYLPDAPPLENGTLAYGAIVNFIRRRCRGLDPFSTTDFCAWFDLELRKVFDFDIFSTPFSSPDYQIYSHPNVHVLLIKVENMTACLCSALQSFLGLPIQAIYQANIGSRKPYHRLYEMVLDTLTIPAADLDRIYRAQYVRHFYSPEEIDGFRRRWLWGRNARPSDSPLGAPMTENAAKPVERP